MEKKKQLEFAYHYGQKCFEFGMYYEDAKMCCHLGDCEDDCEIVRNIPYVREQLDKLTNEQMETAVRECGIGFEEYDGRDVPRDVLELYLVWVSAGEIVDEVYERESQK